MFRDASARDIYSAIGKFTNISVVFDPGFRDQPVSIDLRNETLANALNKLSTATRHFWRSTGERGIIIVPDTQAKRREYEEEVYKTFYLSNADLKETLDILRIVGDARRIAAVTATNAITLRDTAERVNAAGRIISAIDKVRPEVTVDVELLEVNRTHLHVRAGARPRRSRSSRAQATARRSSSRWATGAPKSTTNTLPLSPTPTSWRWPPERATMRTTSPMVAASRPGAPGSPSRSRSPKRQKSTLTRRCSSSIASRPARTRAATAGWRYGPGSHPSPAGSGATRARRRRGGASSSTRRRNGPRPPAVRTPGIPSISRCATTSPRRASRWAWPARERGRPAATGSSRTSGSPTTAQSTRPCASPDRTASPNTPARVVTAARRPIADCDLERGGEGAAGRGRPMARSCREQGREGVPVDARHLAAVREHGGHHVLEARVEHRAELLGAGSSHAAERLAHGGEARQVGHEDRRVDPPAGD